MELVLACIYCALVALALQMIVLRICARNPAMWQRRTIFRLIAVVWSLMPVVKYCYIDQLVPPADSLEHESTARDIADLLTAGRFSDLGPYLSVGNEAYQLLLGTFYAVTGAPEIVSYAVNGAFGLVGLLYLIEILCRHTGCRRLPLSMVFAVGLLPSGLLWTTANLKEGLVLWGICSMLYLTVPSGRATCRAPRVLPFVGLLIVAIQRPHIAAAWLVAIAVGAALDAKRVGLFFATAAAAVLSLALLSYGAPELFSSAMGEGVTTVLSDRYRSLASNESINGIALTGSNPIPVVSGFALIACRPWPFEVHEVVALLAGLEVWALGLLGILSWKAAKRKWKLALEPVMVTQIVALLVLSFYFSYMYNMGLVVRQRLMCFPALLFIYFFPVLASQRSRIPAARRNLVRRHRPALVMNAAWQSRPRRESPFQSR